MRGHRQRKTNNQRSKYTGEHGGRVPPRPPPESEHPTQRSRLDRLVGQESPEVVGQLASRAVPIRWLLIHRLQVDCFQVLRDLVIQPSGRPGIIVKHLLQEHPGIASKRQFAGQELVEHHSHAVDIGARIDAMALAPGLLGAHVGRRAQYFAGQRQRVIAGLAKGQPEVGQARNAIDAEQDVLGLDIAVHQADAVRRRQPLGDPQSDSRRLRDRRLWAIAQAIAQRLAGDEGHHQVQPAVCQRAKAVDRHDVGVVDPGSSPSFTREPSHRRRVALPWRKHLDGDVAFQLRVDPLEHDPHAAPSQFRRDPIRPKTPQIALDRGRRQEVERPPVLDHRKARTRCRSRQGNPLHPDRQGE